MSKYLKKLVGISYVTIPSRIAYYYRLLNNGEIDRMVIYIDGKPIKLKNRKIVRNGGRWVIPLPERIRKKLKGKGKSEVVVEFFI